MSATLDHQVLLEHVHQPVGPGATPSDPMRGVLAAVDRVAAAGRRVTAVRDLLETVARETRALIGAARCSIRLLDAPDGGFATGVTVGGGTGFDYAVDRFIAVLPAERLVRRFLEARRPVVVHEPVADRGMVRAVGRFRSAGAVMAVPMICADEVVGVIFVDDADQPRALGEDQVEAALTFAGLAAGAVIDARAQIDLRARLDAAERQVNALRRATAVDDRLRELLLAGRPLAELLHTLAQLLGKPCAVFGAAGERVATALPDGVAPDGVVPRLLDPDVARRPAVRDALAAHDGRRPFVVGPLPAAGVLHRHVVAPIMIGDELWGSLVMMEHRRRFAAGDLVALRRAATLMAVHVSTERQAAEADWNAGSSLAAELLGGCSDTAVVERRAARLGVSLDTARAVMVVGYRHGEHHEVPDFRAVAAAFRRVAPDLAVHVAPVSSAVAALVGVPPHTPPASFVAEHRETFERVLALLRPAADLVAGISTVHTDPAGYRAAYREAREVVDCIRRFSPAGGPAMFTAEDLGAGRLFLTTCDAQLVTRVAEDTFGSLVGDSRRDLLMTLCTFFENMASIRRSAECLGVHENTIRYRLSRFEELTGLAVMHDPDAKLQARLSLLVLLLRGRLPRPGGPPQDRERPSIGIVHRAV